MCGDLAEESHSSDLVNFWFQYCFCLYRHVCVCVCVCVRVSSYVFVSALLVAPGEGLRGATRERVSVWSSLCRRLFVLLSCGLSRVCVCVCVCGCVRLSHFEASQPPLGILDSVDFLVITSDSWPCAACVDAGLLRFWPRSWSVQDRFRCGVLCAICCCRTKKMRTTPGSFRFHSC